MTHSPTSAVRPRFQDPELGERVQLFAQAVADAGGRAFLVGGAVRDACLGLSSVEADLEVYGLAAERLQTLVAGFGKLHLVGQHFAVLLLQTPHGAMEISLPRRESKTGPGHKGFEVAADPFLDPKEASRRRDFTVNAMLLDPLNQEFLDPWGGRKDLQSGLLRHVSPAFAEDPLRVLRVARFVARFHWRVDPETVRLCRQLDLSELPPERFEEEWRQILLRGDYPGAALQCLEDVGALRFFPELAKLRGVPQDPIWHPEGDVFHHTCLALDAGVSFREEMDDPWVEMLAILCHDLGKANTTVFERGRWRSPNHDVEGETLTRSFLARITREKKRIDAVVALVVHHLRPMQLYQARKRVSDGAIRRLSLKVDIPALVRVAIADGAGRTEPWSRNWQPGQWLLQRAATLGVRDAQPKPFLQGRDLIALGMAPGPPMGALLKQAFERQLEGSLQDREQALAWVRDRVNTV
ncbi:MAG: HD domain-containing protein [Planctomycetota bacterium]|nr:MAG: HD domain-containing protein [Planctomycetota bacterium]